MSRFLVTVLLFACVIGLSPSLAHAYSDGTRFEDPTLLGGAGGRFFTGAPADGYGCAVCHTGGTPPPIVFAGLPAAGWDPGVTYDLTLAFPEGARSASAVVEIADESGQGVGTLELVQDADLDAADRCRDGTAATSIVPVAGRTLARTDACGAARARVRWIAPASALTGLRIFASMVVANDSGDFTGDAAATVATPLRASSAPETEAGHLGQRCSIDHGVGAAPRGSIAWSLFALALLARRRRRWAGAALTSA